MKSKKTKIKYLRLAFDGYSASGKSLGAKLISKKYKLNLLNSGLLYRYAAFLILKNNPKNKILFLKKKFKKLNYKLLTNMNLHTEKISNYSSIIAKQKKVRIILRDFQKKFAKKYNKIAIEGRDISSKILNKNPRYNLAFYFTCKINIAAKRRWKELKKRVPLKEVQKSLAKRTKMDKNRKHSPLKKVKDAILIRTDKLNKKEVLNKMSKEINNII